jgi:endonuclease/exonuclease/phosphatase family metal-dependent hydrolase
MCIQSVPEIHIKILLGDFNTKVDRESIFTPGVWNERLHKISNVNGISIVNFSTSKNLIVKSTMFSHHNIHKFTWTSPDGKIDHILVHRRWDLSVLDGQSFRRVDCDTENYVVVAEVRERLAVSK